MQKKHADKKVFVTGGGSGIGFGVAKRFAEEGASLYLLDISEGDIETAKNALSQLGPVVVKVGSVTDENQVNEAVDEMVSTLGGVDYLVNAAGVVTVQPALENPISDFRRIMDINVTGTWIPCQACAKVMAEAGGGSIVNIGSVYGLGGAPQRTGYCTSKAAIVGLTQSLAIEFGPMNIRVNAVAPTGTRTPMIQGLIDKGIYKLEAVCNRTPLGRLAEVEEVAAACSFLASDEAAMITGTHLPVDGGWMANNFV
jgi:NAD(P)-dependent dehydrogenase (short-subunit alcohol dehydrogenase family)